MNQREKELLELRANKNAEEHAKQAAIAAQEKAKVDKDKANEKRIAAKMAKISSNPVIEEVVVANPVIDVAVTKPAAKKTPAKKAAPKKAATKKRGRPPKAKK